MIDTAQGVLSAQACFIICQDKDHIGKSSSYSVYVEADNCFRAITFDDIEWITSEDKDRISELGLSDDDLPTGFYIYNPDESLKSMNYNDLGNIVLYDRSEEVKQITVTINEFKELLEQHSILCNIVLENNVITSISEMYLP